jgi:O-antigen/teichoic acid export membrane protein
LINKTLLSNLGSLSAVGLLGIASKFTSPLMIIVNAFQNAYLPVYYSIRAENVTGSMDRLASLSKKIWFLACLFFLAVVLLGPPLIHLMTPVEYHSSSELIIYLSIGFLGQVIYTLYAQEIFFSKKTKWIPLLSLCSIGSNLIIVFFFVQEYGAIAVAVGISASQWISAILGSCISARYIDLKIQIRLIAKTLVLLTVLIWLNSKLTVEVTSDVILIGSSIFLLLGFAIIVVWSEAEFRLITQNLTKRLKVKFFTQY